jgi:UDP-N-acetylmuramyl pentapeptide synthase
MSIENNNMAAIRLATQAEAALVRLIDACQRLKTARRRGDEIGEQREIDVIDDAWDELKSTRR